MAYKKKYPKRHDIRSGAKYYALKMIWGMASYFHEGIEKGDFSDNLRSDIHDGRITKKEAREIQKIMKTEADRILKRMAQAYHKHHQKSLTNKNK